jgi:putative endonuclease
MAGYIYFMSNRKNGVIYIGVTSNLAQRVDQHKQGITDGFTKQYSVVKLVYIETYNEIEQAIQREKQLKNWQRGWKIKLIEEQNPEWDDLYLTLNG